MALSVRCVRLVANKQPFQRRYCKDQEKQRPGHQPQRMIRLVRDRPRDDRHGKSVKSETPPWIAYAANDDQQDANHREYKSCEEEHSAHFRHMMTSQWVSGLK